MYNVLLSKIILTITEREARKKILVKFLKYLLKNSSIIQKGRVTKNTMQDAAVLDVVHFEFSEEKVKQTEK